MVDLRPWQSRKLRASHCSAWRRAGGAWRLFHSDTDALLVRTHSGQSGRERRERGTDTRWGRWLGAASFDYPPGDRTRAGRVVQQRHCGNCEAGTGANQAGAVEQRPCRLALAPSCRGSTIDLPGSVTCGHDVKFDLDMLGAELHVRLAPVPGQGQCGCARCRTHGNGNRRAPAGRSLSQENL